MITELTREERDRRIKELMRKAPNAEGLTLQEHMEGLILTGLNIIEDDHPVEVVEDVVKRGIFALTTVVNGEESKEWTGDGERELDDDCCAEILAAVAVFRKKEMQLGDVKNERMRIFDTVLLSGYRSHTPE